MTRGISNWYESENCVNLKSLKNRKNKKERTEVRSSQSRRKETEAVSFTGVFIIRKTPWKVKGFGQKRRKFWNVRAWGFVFVRNIRLLLCEKRGIAEFHRNQKTLPVAEWQLQLLPGLRESRRVIFFHQTFQIEQQVLFRRSPIRFLIALFPNASLASFGRSSFFHIVSP